MEAVAKNPTIQVDAHLGIIIDQKAVTKQVGDGMKSGLESAIKGLNVGNLLKPGSSPNTMGKFYEKVASQELRNLGFMRDSIAKYSSVMNNELAKLQKPITTVAGFTKFLDGLDTHKNVSNDFKKSMAMSRNLLGDQGLMQSFRTTDLQSRVYNKQTKEFDDKFTKSTQFWMRDFDQSLAKYTGGLRNINQQMGVFKSLPKVDSASQKLVQQVMADRSGEFFSSLTPRQKAQARVATQNLMNMSSAIDSVGKSLSSMGSQKEGNDLSALIGQHRSGLSRLNRQTSEDGSSGVRDARQLRESRAQARRESLARAKQEREGHAQSLRFSEMDRKAVLAHGMNSRGAIALQKYGTSPLSASDLRAAQSFSMARTRVAAQNMGEDLKTYGADSKTYQKSAAVYSQMRDTTDRLRTSLAELGKESQRVTAAQRVRKSSQVIRKTTQAGRSLTGSADTLSPDERRQRTQYLKGMERRASKVLDQSILRHGIDSSRARNAAGSLVNYRGQAEQFANAVREATKAETRKSSVARQQANTDSRITGKAIMAHGMNMRGSALMGSSAFNPFTASKSDLRHALSFGVARDRVAKQSTETALDRYGAGSPQFASAISSLNKFTRQTDDVRQALANLNKSLTGGLNGKLLTLRSSSQMVRQKTLSGRNLTGNPATMTAEDRSRRDSFLQGQINRLGSTHRREVLRNGTASPRAQSLAQSIPVARDALAQFRALVKTADTSQKKADTRQEALSRDLKAVRDRILRQGATNINGQRAFHNPSFDMATASRTQLKATQDYGKQYVKASEDRMRLAQSEHGTSSTQFKSAALSVNQMKVRLDQVTTSLANLNGQVTKSVAQRKREQSQLIRQKTQAGRNLTGNAWDMTTEQRSARLNYLQGQAARANLAHQQSFARNPTSARTQAIGASIPDITGKANNFKTKIAEINRELSRSVSAAANSSAAMRRLGNVFANFASYAIGYQAMYGMVGALSALGQGVVDLDRDLYSIQAVTAATDGQMRGLESTILRVAAATMFSTKEVSSATKTLAQAGVQTKEMSTALDAAAKFAAATGSSIDSSATILTTMRNVFPQMEDMTLADQLTRAINISRLTAEDMKTILSLSAQAARSYNLTTEQLLSASAILSNAGLKPSTIATGLRQGMAELMNPDERSMTALLEAYSNIGEGDMTADKLRQRFSSFKNTDNPLAAAVGELRRLDMDGVNSSTMQRAYDVYSMNTIRALVQNYEKLAGGESKITFGATAAQASEIQMKSLVNTVDNLSGAMTALADQIGGGLVRSLQTAALTATDLVDNVAQIDLDWKATGSDGLSSAAAPALMGALTGASFGRGIAGRVVGGLAGGIAGGSMGAMSASPEGMTATLTGVTVASTAVSVLAGLGPAMSEAAKTLTQRGVAKPGWGAIMAGGIGLVTSKIGLVITALLATATAASVIYDMLDDDMVDELKNKAEAARRQAESLRSKNSDAVASSRQFDLSTPVIEKGTSADRLNTLLRRDTDIGYQYGEVFGAGADVESIKNLLGNYDISNPNERRSIRTQVSDITGKESPSDLILTELARDGRINREGIIGMLDPLREMIERNLDAMNNNDPEPNPGLNRRVDADPVLTQAVLGGPEGISTSDLLKSFQGLFAGQSASLKKNIDMPEQMQSDASSLGAAMIAELTSILQQIGEREGVPVSARSSEQVADDSARVEQTIEKYLMQVQTPEQVTAFNDALNRFTEVVSTNAIVPAASQPYDVRDVSKSIHARMAATRFGVPAPQVTAAASDKPAAPALPELIEISGQFQTSAEDRVQSRDSSLDTSVVEYQKAVTDRFLSAVEYLFTKGGATSFLQYSESATRGDIEVDNPIQMGVLTEAVKTGNRELVTHLVQLLGQRNPETGEPTQFVNNEGKFTPATNSTVFRMLDTMEAFQANQSRLELLKNKEIESTRYSPTKSESESQYDLRRRISVAEGSGPANRIPVEVYTELREQLFALEKVLAERRIKGEQAEVAKTRISTNAERNLPRAEANLSKAEAALSKLTQDYVKDIYDYSQKVTDGLRRTYDKAAKQARDDGDLGALAQAQAEYWNNIKSSRTRIADALKTPGEEGQEAQREISESRREEDDNKRTSDKDDWNDTVNNLTDTILKPAIRLQDREQNFMQRNSDTASVGAMSYYNDLVMAKLRTSIEQLRETYQIALSNKDTTPETLESLNDSINGLTDELEDRKAQALEFDGETTLTIKHELSQAFESEDFLTFLQNSQHTFSNFGEFLNGTLKDTFTSLTDELWKTVAGAGDLTDRLRALASATLMDIAENSFKTAINEFSQSVIKYYKGDQSAHDAKGNEGFIGPPNPPEQSGEENIYGTIKDFFFGSSNPEESKPDDERPASGADDDEGSADAKAAGTGVSIATTIMDTMTSTIDGLSGTLSSVLSSVFNAIFDSISGNKGSSGGGGWGQIFSTVISAIGGSFSTGGTLNPAAGGIRPVYSKGGIVRGPGTPTSDSILGTVHGAGGKVVAGIAVSDREAILSYKARQLLGDDFIHAANNGRLLKYATGGIIGESRTMADRSSTIASSINANSEAPSIQMGDQKIVNVIDPAIAGDYLDTRVGEKKVLNILRRNGVI